MVHVLPLLESVVFSQTISVDQLSPIIYHISSKNILVFYSVFFYPAKVIPRKLAEKNVSVEVYPKTVYS